MIGSDSSFVQRVKGLWGAYLDRWTTVLLWGCLLLAILSTVPVYMLTRYITDNMERSDFVIAAEEAANRLAREVDVTLTHLRAVKGLYRGSVHVSRNEFSAFVRALGSSEAVQALKWVPRVLATERAEMEAAARSDGYADFAIREYDEQGVAIPAAARPEYYPVYYLEPYAGNEAALGLDLGSHSSSLEAMRRARDGGQQTASGRVRLASGRDDNYGILVFDPFYAEKAVTLDVRFERLEGFALGVFRIADLVRLAIPEDQFEVSVFDLSAGSSERQLYPIAGGEQEPALHSGLHHTVPLEIADRVWSVQLAPSTTAARSTLPWLTGAIWLVAILALWTFRELISSRRHSRELALVNHRLETLSDLRRQAIQELERSNRELDDFAYIVSHDLKEPLRAVSNHARFLLEDCQDHLDPKSKNRLDRLIVLSQRMQRLISDLLDFSRLGRGEPAMETVDPNEVIADIEISLKEALQRQNATIVIAEPLPKIQGHRPHIKVLLQNLICNGIRYSDAAEKVVEIGCQATETTGLAVDTYCFHVRDNGIGIDEKFKDDVFRIFRRLNSDQVYGEGTGAGLSFVKKIVENHGGTIWLTSSIGKGTTFFFTLRAADRPSLEQAQLEAA